MDPLTAALVLANTVAEIVKLAIESQPPEVRAEFAKMHLEDMKKWREFVERFTKRETMAKKKTPKATIKKAHKIARKIPAGKVRNRFAVGMAAAKKAAAKRKRKR